MTARRKARKRALDILFESDLRGTDALETAAVRIAAAEPPVPEYTVTLVEGVQAQRLRIDELIATYSEGWSLARLPGVDRALLRMAIYELLWTDVPAAVVVDEAVELAKSLSTADSPRFVNGLLGRIALLGPSLRA